MKLVYSLALTVLFLGPFARAQSEYELKPKNFIEFEWPADTLDTYMDLVLTRDYAAWSDEDYETALEPKWVGAEPTFAPTDPELRDAFLSKVDPRETLPIQVEALRLINGYYNDDYRASDLAERFPCRTLARRVYHRNRTSKNLERTEKFGILDGVELSVFECADRQTGQTTRFLFTIDPGVIEVFLQPDTFDNMQAKKPLLQAVLWDTLKRIGFRPDPTRGMGHLHFSYHLFDGAKHVQNYVRHVFNHSELFDGIWEDDHFNAKPLRPFLQSHIGPSTIMRALTLDVTKQVDFAALFEMSNQASRTAGFGINIAHEHDTVELLGNHAFESADLMVAQMKIMLHAIDATRRFDEIKYIHHERKMPEQMLHDYYQFVGGSVDHETARGF